MEASVSSSTSSDSTAEPEVGGGIPANRKSAMVCDPPEWELPPCPPEARRLTGRAPTWSTEGGRKVSLIVDLPVAKHLPPEEGSDLLEVRGRCPEVRGTLHFLCPRVHTGSLMANRNSTINLASGSGPWAEPEVGGAYKAKWKSRTGRLGNNAFCL